MPILSRRPYTGVAALRRFFKRTQFLKIPSKAAVPKRAAATPNKAKPRSAVGAVKKVAVTAKKPPAKRAPASTGGAATGRGKSALTGTSAKPRPASRKAPAKSAAKSAKPAGARKAPALDKLAKVAAGQSDQGPLAPEVAALRRHVLRALEDLKAKDVKEIDIRGKASFADLLVIASGTSTRHVKSLADEVVRFVKKAGMMPLGVEGEREAEWVLVDLGDIVCHLMLPRIRDFYALESMWSVAGDATAND